MVQLVEHVQSSARPQHIAGWAPFVLVGAVAMQVLHQMEHVAQVVQAKVVGTGPAHGIIGALDVEWVHMTFNTSLLALAALALWGYANVRGAPGTSRRRSWTILAAGVALQSYHVIEHIAKIGQHTVGITPAPGFLGQFLELIWLHFAINAVVLAAITEGMVGLSAHRTAARLLRTRVPA